MPIYKIDWSEKKPTSTGKMKLDAILVGEDGVKVENVTIWGNFPNFGTLMTGNDVEGTIQEKQNGNYLNRTLYPIKPVNPPPGGAKRPLNASITKAMETKREGIKEAQENRSEAVRIASTFRDATLITVSQMGTGGGDEGYQKNWLKWRSWLWQNWDVDETNEPPFK